MPVREATPADIPAIFELVRELAEFEKLLHEFELTEDRLHEGLFGESPAVFAHVSTKEDGAVVGYAIWFLTYSTFLGRHGIYLEDLLIAPSERGNGHGTALLKHLAAIAVERGYGRFEWAALDWNEKAIKLYKNMGATAMREWVGFRMTGEALKHAAG